MGYVLYYMENIDFETRARFLLNKVAQNTITLSEYQELLTHLAGHQDKQQQWLDLLQESIGAERPPVDELQLELHLRRIDNKLEQDPRMNTQKHFRLSPALYKYAAAILLFIGLSVGLFLAYQHRTALRTELAEDLSSKQRATITLSDGSVHYLDTQSGALITDQRGTRYAGQERLLADAQTQDILLEIPRGSIYQVTLPDGTKVSLNADSKLRYPGRFQGTRVVELQGEAFFEVTHQEDQPFIVHTQGQQLLVLGTKFNVNSYAESEPKTTLVEGKVKVLANQGSKSVVLKPGQQATLSRGEFAVQRVNVNDITGWTENMFIFNNLWLSEIMDQLERWYDIQVDYPPGYTDERFYAEIPRDRPLQDVLSYLQKASRYQFEIKGRRVQVK